MKQFKSDEEIKFWLQDERMLCFGSSHEDRVLFSALNVLSRRKKHNKLFII